MGIFEREECKYKELKFSVLGCIHKGSKYGIAEDFHRVHKIGTRLFGAGNRRGSFKVVEDCLNNGHVVMVGKGLLLVQWTLIWRHTLTFTHA